MKKENYAYLLSEVATLLKLILVLPAANAQCERSFSSLKRVKPYLRNNMDQDRLNHLMCMTEHKNFAQKVCLEEVADEFVSRFERRRTNFGIRKAN